MARLNNLILGILLSKKKYRSIPTARHYFIAHPAAAVDASLRLSEHPDTCHKNIALEVRFLYNEIEYSVQDSKQIWRGQNTIFLTTNKLTNDAAEFRSAAI